MAAILVPIDFSDVSHVAVPVAAEHARQRGDTVVLLLVGELPETIVQAGEAKAQRRRIIDAATRQLGGVSVRHRSDDSESAAQAILNAIVAEDIAEVVIADAYHTADSQVARQGVIDEVRSKTNVPMTVVHHAERARLA